VRGETHKKFKLKTLKERDHLGKLGAEFDNIKTNFKLIACEDVDWIQLASG
jgi:hypothetical protein